MTECPLVADWHFGLGNFYRQPSKQGQAREQFTTATKLLFLALRNITKDWTMPQHTWKHAANQFAIVFGERLTNPTS